MATSDDELRELDARVAQAMGYEGHKTTHVSQGLVYEEELWRKPGKDERLVVFHPTTDPVAAEEVLERLHADDYGVSFGMPPIHSKQEICVTIFRMEWEDEAGEETPRFLNTGTAPTWKEALCRAFVEVYEEASGQD